MLPDIRSKPIEDPDYNGPTLVEAKGKITEPEIVELKDGSKGTIYPVYKVSEISTSLFKFLYQEFNDELERGTTYPYYYLQDEEEFKHSWFGSFTAILIKGENSNNIISREDIDWESECLGTFYIKPNYAGRCSHNCNAGFLVNPRIRGKGVGKSMGKCYLKWAPILGYTYSVFNLVFVTNVASAKIWDSLGFDRIGYLPRAGILKGYDEPVDAILFGKDLV